MSSKGRNALFSTLFCLLFLIVGKVLMMLSQPIYPLFFILAIISGGWKQTFEGVSELLNERTLNVDLLMALAAIGACLIGNWFEGAMLTFIFCLSGTLEEYATNKSKKEITALMNVTPNEALKICGTEHIATPVEKINVGDLVFVPKGQAIPIDGRMLNASLIDESAISGESVPVEKKINDEAFSGTINLGHAFTLEVTKTSDNTLFAQILRLVDHAQNEQSATATFIEKIENIYVKIILCAVPLMILLTHFLLGWSFTESFYRGMVLLVVASPCALVASATPATLAAISNGAKKGLLFKSGKTLEKLADLHVISFDKTGTLTQGDPHVTDYKSFSDNPVIPQLFLSMEKHSTHPLAVAITTFFSDEDSLQLKVEEKAGFGLETNYLNQTWRLGKPLENQTHPLIEQWHKEGKTVVVLSQNNQLAALIALIDLPKPHTKEVIDYFQEQGIQTIMLTGDNFGAANYVAQQVGLSNFYSGCLPADKTKLVKEQQQDATINAMVGDGINDAPALATASIGIAMGEGTDVAMEVADMVLMKNDLTKLTYSHRLAKKMKRVIRQNIVFSLSVIILLIASNFLQFLTLPLGVIGHEGSTILVILNGLRLLLPLKELDRFNKSSCVTCPLYKATL
ncbi:heavy metal translocating P-type ATPase [Enterococcus xiangfangensis]|uniref:heavy metal translocating P-type ATPase n=1 Tax=Enterococcus xiangfangensis TaxID=1296537 RepID=UPI0010F49CD4|nr:heavy metal translocating P-type ATPase [Enterococcus xiangfangensis]MBM7711711.1 Cd2+/Zn2+-exporting ATPase [Enterococcus xiangfangensis]NBK07548.1 cadmium-translocating P-type ATPase [Enterococcus asini]